MDPFRTAPRTLGLAAVILAVVSLTWPRPAFTQTPMPPGSRTVAPGSPRTPPPTPKRPVVDTIHGVRVADDYRWLENWDDPEVRQWTATQNAFARSFLDSLPHVAAIRERLVQLDSAPRAQWSALRFRHGRLFALKFQPPKQQPFLVTMARSADPASEKVVVDPNVLDAKGTTAIDFYVPSLDARLVAVSLSQGGTERGDVHVYDVGSGKALPDVVPRVNGGTAGGSVAWNADGSGFFYTRYPRPGERPDRDLDFYQQVYFHKLGTPPADDRYVLGREFPRIAEIQLQSSDDGKYVLAQVANGDGGEFAYHLEAGERWVELATFTDGVVAASFAPSGALFLLSHKDAPRGRVLRLDPEDPRLAAATVVAQATEGAIERVRPTATRLYVSEILGGPSAVRVVDLGGKTATTIPIPPISSVSEIVALDGDEILFRRQSYVDPPAWYRYAPGGSPQKTALALDSPADFSGVSVRRDEATSKDGTRVPMTILMKTGAAKNGRTPTLLYGYGGYDISLVPSFVPSRLAWIEQGAIYVEANIRGGGEFGEPWHEAGRLTKKQNVFDDFAACAAHLVEAGYTSRATLAIEGGSNGGLLMGAELTQHPEMFRAVVSHVGIYDMMRFEQFPNGVFNVTEYGTIADPAQFKALLAYSPYQHVVDGTRYPAVLFTSGTNDPRVNPADSRKMTARLQAATTSGQPVLLRVSGGGHGIGSSLDERIEQRVDVLAFLFAELGLDYAR